jgi:hypothetical protein
MVEKLHPVFAGERSRKSRYVITDNFLASWLRGLARNVQVARIRPVNEAIGRSDEGLRNQEGYGFEKMIRLLVEECSRKGVGDFALTDFVRGYWNKAGGSDVEIDLVAYNDESQVVRFGSCKRSAARHDGSNLRSFDGHIGRFLKSKEGHRFTGWSMQRALYAPVFEVEKRKALEAKGYICRDLIDYAGFLGLPGPPLFEEEHL